MYCQKLKQYSLNSLVYEVPPKKGVAIVASQGQVLHLRVQAGVGLGGCNRFNAVLQRHPRPQKLRVGSVAGSQDSRSSAR